MQEKFTDSDRPQAGDDSWTLISITKSDAKILCINTHDSKLIKTALFIWHRSCQ